MPLGIRLFFLDVVALASAEALKKIKKGWTIHSPEMKQQDLILGAEDSNLTRALSSLRAWGDWGEENTRYLEASKEKKAFLWPS